MSNLSTLSSPGKFNQHNFVASGTLASGQAVALNTDGTVSVVDAHSKVDVLGTGVPIATQPLSVSGFTRFAYTGGTFDPVNNKVVICYTDPDEFHPVKVTQNQSKVVVGTVSGTTISFGTPVDLFQAWAVEPSATFDSNSNKVVIAYRDGDNSWYGTAVVGTVSGTTISLGTPVIFNSTSTLFTSTVFDPVNNKVVIAYTDGGNSWYGTAVVGTVSGTTISFGTSAVFTQLGYGSAGYPSATFDSNSNKVVIAYRRSFNFANPPGAAVVGTVSGTDISFGTPVVFNSVGTTYLSATFDSFNNKVVIAYQDGGNSNYGTAIVGTVSGTTISFGTPVVFESATTSEPAPTFDSNSNKVVIAYRGSSNYGKVVVGTVSGTTISLGTPVIFNSNGLTQNIVATYDSTNNKVAIACKDNGNNYGTAVVFDLQSAIGTPAVYESAFTEWISSTFDSVNNKVVIAYRDNDNSNYGTAVVGTVSGTGISFGTPVVFESADTIYTSTVFDPVNNKVVIVYRDGGNSDYGTAVVGTVAGTTISFGTPVVFESSSVSYTAVTFDSTTNKVVVAYGDGGNSGYGTAIVGTVSGTSISFGTPVVFDSAFSTYTSATYDSTNGKVVIAYRRGVAGSPGAAVVGTVSGTDISFGTPANFDGYIEHISVTFDSLNNKVVIAYKDAGNLNYGTAIVGTVAGTGISYGTPVVFESAATDEISTVFDPFNNKVVIAHRSSGGKIQIGTVSGTDISFGTPVIFNSVNADYCSAVFDSLNNKVVIAYKDGGNSNYGTGVVLDAQDANSTDFIGITDQAIADTTRGSVTMKGGISSNVTGLTPNLIYYVQEDGSLSTTPSAVLAGKALAATKINLEYTS
jgi:hypothetical protein